MTEIEASIEMAWTRAIGEAPATREENFFSAGGTSLQAAMLVATLRDEGIDVPLDALFEDGRFSRLVVEAVRMDR